MEADGVGDVVEFFAADLFESFAFGGELLVDFDGGFGHGFVSGLGAANEGKIGASGDAFVSIGIETEAKHQRGLFLLRHD